MLTFETRNRLADLFLAISDGERQIEIVRQILCEQIDFEPYAAFKRIDRSRKGAIDSYDILRFLADNKLQHTEEGCRSFIKRYDVDGDGQLIYNEFLCSVLPMDNPTLRTIAAQRPNYEVNENQLLAYDVEYSLSKVIDREIAFYASLDFPKASLHRCPDFNYLDAFSAINITSGKITFDKIEAFFNKLALYPSEDELVALLRRLDRDDDGCLTYEEFVIGLQPHDHNLIANINRPNHTSATKSRVYSPSRSLAHFEPASLNGTTSNFSLQRAVTPRRQDPSPYKTVASPRRILDSSLRRAASPTRRVGSPTRVVSPSRVISPGASMGTMKFTRSSPFQESYIRPSYASIGQERVLSPVKSAAKESQFGFRSTASTLKIGERPTSPYRVTLKHASRVQSSPLRQSDLSVVDSRSPLRQQETMKRSANGEINGNRGVLKSSEKSILKKNGLYSSMSTSFSDKSQTMSTSIKNESKRNTKFERTEEREGLVEVLKQFVKLEKELEAVKQDLAMRSDFNLLDFFRIFDVDERGAISSNEIREGFERFNVIPSKEQLYLFMRRFDRDNDGKLKFSDFAEAFTCKQQEYANLLNNRIPAKGEPVLNLDQAFGESTRKTIARALRTHLDNEISIESLRQRLTRRYKLNTHEGFTFLDLKEDGVITSDEIGEVLDKSHCYATQKEVSLVIDRMDSNGDGKVTYSEFVQEMTPKSDVTF